MIAKCFKPLTGRDREICERLVDVVTRAVHLYQSKQVESEIEGIILILEGDVKRINALIEYGIEFGDQYDRPNIRRYMEDLGYQWHCIIADSDVALVRVPKPALDASRDPCGSLPAKTALFHLKCGLLGCRDRDWDDFLKDFNNARSRGAK